MLMVVSLVEFDMSTYTRLEVTLMETAKHHAVASPATERDTACDRESVVE